jgi:hypothetical protein
VEGPAHLLNKEVWGTGGERGWVSDGTHAEYVVIPEEDVILKPSTLSMEQAAAVSRHDVYRNMYGDCIILFEIIMHYNLY